MAPPRRIAHLDMDAFFASVELLRYPQLQELPVVIGGERRREDDALAAVAARYGGRLNEIPAGAFPRLVDYTGRGVITTATYAARQFGIGSAMGLMKAARLCPQAIVLPVDFAEYRRYSRQFKDIVTSVAPLMEEAGMDEVYIDLTHVQHGKLHGQQEGGRVLAQHIQQRIAHATGLTCSIGVAPNKLLAKMASEFNKPNSISIVAEGDVPTRIWPLPCRKLNGIGPKTDAKLQSYGIHTIGELAAHPRDWLLEHFGRAYGAWLHAVAQGHDERPLVIESAPLSVSRETTFTRNLHAVRDRAELGRIFTALCQQVAADLQSKGYVGRTIGIKLRHDDFTTVTRAVTLQGPARDAVTIRRTAGLCLKYVCLERPLRLLGVRVSNLAPQQQWAYSPMKEGACVQQRLL